MRSRYTAFALGDRDYLLQTWHPDHRPQELRLDDDLRWIGLDIFGDVRSVGRATVEFEASLLADGTVSAMRERSEFVLDRGRWLYTRGEQLKPSFAPYQPGRNQPCPCGSAVKFKRCCGRR